MFVCLDDVFIYSDCPDQHENHVSAVLQCFLVKQLFVKEDKCEFDVSIVPLLGLIFESGQVKADPQSDQGSH